MLFLKVKTNVRKKKTNSSSGVHRADLIAAWLVNLQLERKHTPAKSDGEISRKNQFAFYSWFCRAERAYSEWSRRERPVGILKSCDMCVDLFAFATSVSNTHTHIH